jgi:hypothetical protein
MAYAPPETLSQFGTQACAAMVASGAGDGKTFSCVTTTGCERRAVAGF